MEDIRISDDVLKKCEELHYEFYQERSNRKLKLALLKEFGVCAWCGKKVKDYGPRKEGMGQPHDEATVDHLVSRFFRKKGERSLKVLACDRCNQRRSREEQKKYGRHLDNRLDF